MLRLNVDDLKRSIAEYSGFRTVGKLHSAHGVITARLQAGIGELCEIRLSEDQPAVAEVIGFDREYAQIMSFHRFDGARPGQEVTACGQSHRVPVGWKLLGRVLNGLGEPIDGGPPIALRTRPSIASAPAPLSRPRIDTRFVTGQRAIDGLLCCGRGQRVGLFAGSGVGKSTLLGEIAKGAESDVNVLALIGERGREVVPFLEDCLGPQGRERSVVVVSTADETPLMRVRALTTALTIADDFRRQGCHVLLLLDSLTRLAMAQREIGLLRGEPPTARGFTPSVFQLLAETLEQMGTSETGSITGILSVLVDGDDMNEPIADATRSILDGHIVLDRKLAAKGHFPAIDVSASLSRVFHDVTTAQHQTAARKLRSILATHAEVSDLLQIGAYQRGAMPAVDRAIDLLPGVEAFLRQQVGDERPFEQTLRQLLEVTSGWEN